jgi:hypothetical protein
VVHLLVDSLDSLDMVHMMHMVDMVDMAEESYHLLLHYLISYNV